MRKLFLTLLIAVVFVSATFAQGITPDLWAHEICIQLNLPAEYSAKLSVIYQECESKINKINTSNLTLDQKKIADLAQLSKSDSKIKKLLGPDKYKEYQKLDKKLIDGTYK